MKKTEGYIVKELEDEYIVLPVGERTEEVNEVISLSETAGFIYIHDIGVRPHKEKINISKEFINKTKER